MRQKPTPAELSAIRSDASLSREVVESQCLWCGKQIVGIKIRRYCDWSCRQKHHRAMKKGRSVIHES